MKFKVGDRVEVIDVFHRASHGSHIGFQSTVKSAHTIDTILLGKVNAYRLNGQPGDPDAFYHEDHLRLIPPDKDEKTDYIPQSIRQIFKTKQKAPA